MVSMTDKTIPHIELPRPVAAYFAADRAGADAVARCFTEGAVVLDEGREHRGRVEIARWKQDAAAKYRYTSEPIESWATGAAVTVLGRVTGNFPGSPVQLRYVFTVDGDAIARLEIAP